MDIREPKIDKKEILILEDESFNRRNVCIVTGCGTGIGRATAVAAAANQLTVVGLDINELESLKTIEIAEQMGGEMVFVKTDLAVDEDSSGFRPRRRCVPRRYRCPPAGSAA